ncbi:Hypothetical protein NTJ_09080 [Nesidiocoris tenuis]|uniref:PWWP domain-containing protein n=1 Tax=Nesidiocoris tenuis TaxID=355587 RepID=A0ABN7AZE6_9HEMI|nr:Hypothetical protein NTJ_09080 [Nesidiocoris tenuis]
MAGSKAGSSGTGGKYDHGTIVAAKLGRFPRWPAMVDLCPETNGFSWAKKENCPPTHYHVVFFDNPDKVTRSWIAESSIVPYRTQFPTPVAQKEIDAVKSMKSTALKRRLVEARHRADQALTMASEERREKCSFLSTYKGTITMFDDDGKKTIIKRKEPKSTKAPSAPRKRKRNSSPTENEAHPPIPKIKICRLSEDLSTISSIHPDEEIPVDKEISSVLSNGFEVSRTKPEAAKEGRGRKRQKGKKRAKPGSKKSKVASAAQESSPAANQTSPVAARKSKSAHFEAEVADPEPIGKPEGDQVSSRADIPLELPSSASMLHTPAGKSFATPEVPKTKEKPKTNHRDYESDCDRSFSEELRNVMNQIKNTPIPLKKTEKTISNLSLMLPKTETIFPKVDLTLNDCSIVEKLKCGDIVYAQRHSQPAWPAVVRIDEKKGSFLQPNSYDPTHVFVFFLVLNQSNWVPLKNVTLFEEGLESKINIPKFHQAVHEARSLLGTPHDLRVAQLLQRPLAN